VNGEVEYVEDVAAAFADLVVREQPRTIALSGGDTARRCYELLASRSGIDWPSVQVLFGDERVVPVSDPESNEGMARAELLEHVDVGEIHSLVNSGAEPYENLLQQLGSIDLVHLGMGPDGHTASLFPGTPALDVTDKLVVPNGDTDHPHPRLTFTFAGIALGRHIVFTIEGEEKVDAWRRVRSGDDLPAGRVYGERITWLVDRHLSS
jgi:6-phosphogluconolactonase